jgi:hypothetical protein
LPGGLGSQVESFIHGNAGSYRYTMDEIKDKGKRRFAGLMNKCIRVIINIRIGIIAA